MLHLADTSFLIDALRERGDPGAGARLDELLAADALAVWGLVISEMLIGTLSEPEYDEMHDYLLQQTVLHEPADLWQRVARLGFDLRRRGLTVALPDLAPAVVAMHNEVPLVHMDRDFELIAQACDLEHEYVSPTDAE